MAKSITVIPAKENNFENASIHKKRVCAYARVSTLHEEQLNSYGAQVSHYTNYINNHPDYDFVYVYADEGITGTSTKKREQFNKMIQDCREGKIDLIITKSISRFARNTVDIVQYARELKELGIGILFEKESINTLDTTGEVLLTILSSLAQDESRSISENSTWGIRRSFEEGKIYLNCKRFIGYDKDEEGNLVINKEQAKIVKRIYDEFLNGKGAKRIAKELEDDSVIGPSGKVKWYDTTIKSMLKNEKFKGDSLLQKSYTKDFLTKKRAVNDGVITKYYVTGSHDAIINKDTWNAVQLEFDRRKNYMKKYKISCIDFIGGSTFRSKVICGYCNKAYGRKTWNSTDSNLKTVIWQCSEKYRVKGEIRCSNKHIDDSELYEIFIEAFNKIVDRKEFYIKNGEKILIMKIF